MLKALLIRTCYKSFLFITLLVANVFFSSAFAQNQPFFKNVTPVNNAVNVSINDFQINVEIVTPPNYELDFRTLAGNVNLYEINDQGEFLIPSNSNDTGGGDAITLTPINRLKEFTKYIFRITSGLQANRIGNINDRLSFLPFESTFETGEASFKSSTDRDLSNVSFTKVSGTALGDGTLNQRFSSLAIGPDGRLYASTIGDFQSDGQIYRWDMLADGTLSNLKIFSPDLKGSIHPVTGVPSSDNRLIIGLTFDPNSNRNNPVVYVTHSEASITNGPEWDGVLTRLSGPNFSQVQDIVIHLPRSAKDHLTNSITFDKEGNLYISQGSNTAGGAPDPNWANRPERLLAAAVLKLDLTKLTSLPLDAYTTDNIQVINSAPTDAITMSDGTYNPYAINSPLTVFASGIRNAYDLVWHSNGWLYIPTNGTAGNNFNSPNTPSTSDYPLAKRLDLLTTIPSTPSVLGGETQKDWLFTSRGGSYHGHPNPYRGEFVLNNGGKPYSNVFGQIKNGYIDVRKYPASVGPDPNYRLPAYDFDKNKSPNGVIEYKSNAFQGVLKKLLMVTRFSGQDDIITLNPTANGNIQEVYTDIPGLRAFDDPLDIIEDPLTGNLYVSEYDRDGDGQAGLTLLRADIPAATGGRLRLDTKELIFEVVINNQAPNTETKAIQVTNYGTRAVFINEIVIEGTFSNQFQIIGDIPFIITPEQTISIDVIYRPQLNQQDIGYQDAKLVIRSTSQPSNELEIGLFGLKKLGLEGSREPTLQDVVDVLGYNIDVGWTTLANNVDPELQGEEVPVQRWRKQEGKSRVKITALARYSPAEELPFGWYTVTDEVRRFEVGAIASGLRNAQRLFPPLERGTDLFNPNNQIFGIFHESKSFKRFNYSQDVYNTGGVAHRTRVYPVKNRNGVPVPNSFLVFFEDANNGDYQDYMFLLENVIPVNEEIEYTYQFNFRKQGEGTPSPIGYTDDIGLPYGTRTSNGNTFTFGWVEPGTLTPVSAEVNARDRDLGPLDDQLLSTHSVVGHRNSRIYPLRDWLVKVPNGAYEVEISVGDPNFSDSKHVFDVNDLTIVNWDQEKDNPEGLANFVNRGNILVTDGIVRLRLNEEGDNAKINYIRLAPVDETLVAPIINVSYKGEALAENIFLNSAEITISATARSANGSITNLEYQIDGGASTDYTAPFTLDKPGTYNLEVTTIDTYGNTTKETFTISIIGTSEGVLAIENLTKIPGTNRSFPGDDFFTFHNVGVKSSFVQLHDSNIMRLSNTGSTPLQIGDIAFENKDDFVFDFVEKPGEADIQLPVTIAPNKFRDVEITFIRTRGDKSVAPSDCFIKSNALNGIQTVTFNSAFMRSLEGDNELTAQQVFESFGFQSNMLSLVNDLGTIEPPNPNPTRPSSSFPTEANVNAGNEGDLILSSNFVQADPSQPVIGFQLSALHGRDRNGARFLKPNSREIVGSMDFTHGTPWYQSLLPKNNAGNLINSDIATSIEGPFRIAIANRYATTGGNTLDNDRPDLLGVRTYKVYDRSGNIVPNEYIVVQDFIGNGCGAASANCDWNDNVFYFINIRPEILPSATQIDDKTVRSKEAFSYDITSSFNIGFPGNKLSYTIEGVDQDVNAWLAIDAELGIITGVAPDTIDADVALLVKATDLNGNEVSATFTLNVILNPVAVEDFYRTNRNITLIITDLLNNDTDPNGQNLKIISVTNPQFGMVELNTTNNSVSYIPRTDYVGDDAFTYTIQNENGDTATATVAIAVENPNLQLITYNIVNADSNEFITELVNDTVLKNKDYKNIKITIKAVTKPEIIGSVKFKLTGPIEEVRTENTVPYLLFGDRGTNLVQGKTLVEGNYILEGTPYSFRSGNGVKGRTNTMAFSVKAEDSIDENPDVINPEIKEVLFPNPLYNYEEITFLTSKTNITEMYLFSINGLEIRSFKPKDLLVTNGYVIPAMYLGSGVYMLQIIRSDGSEEQFKIIIK
ncbi:Ig-like domain-containing protein [Aquimarina sp. ERC-38]|uniref:Ig-like domain-containing protein n=1 Tax=Aquimarina sp. ERC-38 TaxID=2949996 RepID=UPI00224538DD|nr:Ig-like domain-containing protein [Aquimarina sp. ERC-38]UZO79515.1 Ig-like domain-containing protein [Aquimarina sp. ERC-38]